MTTEIIIKDLVKNEQVIIRIKADYEDVKDTIFSRIGKKDKVV